VVGAGIGGIALARGLVADQHRVRVLERGTGPSTSGAAVTIFSNGAAAAAGLGADFADLGGDIHELCLHRSTGRPLLHTDLRHMRARTGFAIRTVPRVDLISRLSEGLDENHVQFDARVVAIHPEGADTIVELADGSVLRPDVVVGADGYRSVVRHATLADGYPEDVGWATWQGLSPVLPNIAAGTSGRLFVGGSGLVGLMPAGNGLTQWWFDARRPAPVSAGSDALSNSSKTDSLTWLHDAFGSYADPVPELLEQIDVDDIGYFPHVLRDPSPPWGRGAVTLLGDAAHAFPPSQAQGANQALEDAWLLRGALAPPRSTGNDLPDALRRYERRRAARVRLVSRMAASERTNRPPGPVLGLLARHTPASITGRGYARLVRRISSVLHDDHV
jgi:FAD-dependent urate hydroxylase